MPVIMDDSEGGGGKSNGVACGTRGSRGLSLTACSWGSIVVRTPRPLTSIAAALDV